MPYVAFDSTELDISGLAVTLALGDAPILEVLIDRRGDFDPLALLRTLPQCHLKWHDKIFPFELLGFELAGEARTRVVGRCIDHAAREWFAATALGSDAGEVAYVIYQRGLKEEAKDYFARMFAPALRSAGTDFTALAVASKPLGCMIRDSAIDNRTHLNRVCRLVRKSVPQLLGWWANGKNEGFVHLAITGKAVDADLSEGWVAPGATRLSGYDGQTMRRSPLVLHRSFRGLTEPHHFLAQLLLAEGDRWGGLAQVAQLPGRPGSFMFGAQRWICASIRYELRVPGFVSNPGAGSVVVTATLDAPLLDDEAGGTRLWVEGVAGDWSADGGQLELNPPKGGNWTVMAAPGGTEALLAVPLSPTGFGANRGHAGFYARHIAGDNLVVAIDGHGMPHALGGHRRRIAAIDEAAFDLVLSAAKVGLLTSSDASDPTASDGLVAAGRKTTVSGDQLSVLGTTLIVAPGEVDATGDVTVHGTFDATP
ncbi:hypothetical protein [Bradyrhizobium sp. sGM-13]|uniref:hypothetical protein n=1 Tax=Bradyrhizobium sp. sGM-13 TaxID=2831781 RepID=UPI001BCB9319|nr:hypothetical protein [Bradyrhizobium sp. sGM-13]